MQSRRDQLHAYRFLTRRAVAALVTGEPDVMEPPMRRLTLTTVSGIMIGVLVVAAFALIGLLKPGSNSDSWRANGSVVVERETGARYVMLAGVLHPAINYASALLAAAGTQGAKATLVDQSDLAHVQRGPAIGIPGAPDSLPTAGRLVRGPWTVCSTISQPAVNALVAKVSLDVGDAQSSTSVGADDGVLVATTIGNQYLLWHGQRLGIASSEVVAALGIQNTQPLVVGSALLDAVPTGPLLATPTIAQAGTPSAAIPGAVVGQLIHAADTGLFFVALPDGVVQVDPLQTSLLRTLVLTGRHLDPIETTESVVLGLNSRPAAATALTSQFTGLPQTVPTLNSAAGQAGALCASYGDGGTRPQLSVPAGTAPISTVAVTESAQGAAGIVDTVTVSPGRAAVVQADDGSATVFVVAEAGKKFASTSAAALSALGYGAVKPVKVPAALIRVIPSGPALDPAAARTSAGS